jgi:hypothetical protein
LTTRPSQTIDLSTLCAAVTELVSSVDRLYGLYLDSGLGFLANAEQLRRGQEHSRSLVPPGTDLDSLPHFIGRGDPNDPANVLQHRTTQGQFLRRNERGGENHVLVSQMLVVLICSFWEHEFRPRLADVLHVLPSEILVPIFGDLRLLRNDIVHNRGILQETTIRRLEVVAAGQPGTTLTFNDAAIETLVRNIKSALDALVVRSGGSDPQHRTLWHLH